MPSDPITADQRRRYARELDEMAKRLDGSPDPRAELTRIADEIRERGEAASAAEAFRLAAVQHPDLYYKMRAIQDDALGRASELKHQTISATLASIDAGLSPADAQEAAAVMGGWINVGACRTEAEAEQLLEATSPDLFGAFVQFVASLE